MNKIEGTTAYSCYENIEKCALPEKTPLTFHSNDSSSGYDAFGHEDEDQFPDGGLKAWTVVIGSAFGLMTVFSVMDTVASIQLYITREYLGYFHFTCF